MTTNTEEAWAKVGRYDKWLNRVIWVMCLMCLLAVIWASIFTALFLDLREKSNISACNRQVFAQFFAGVGDALNAPPAPNPARALAVTEIEQATKDLHNIEKNCNG